jgi:4a-hydroxytetrahydrobiopterin dehydratase
VRPARIAYPTGVPTPPLSEPEIGERMAEHPEWELRGDRIARTFRFGSFAEAFGWMTSAAIVADKLDHHPEWRNVYDRVEVELTTHDAGGLTGRDFALARAMDDLAAG